MSSKRLYWLYDMTDAQSPQHSLSNQFISQSAHTHPADNRETRKYNTSTALAYHNHTGLYWHHLLCHTPPPTLTSRARECRQATTGFTICLCISLGLDGYSAPKNETLAPATSTLIGMRESETPNFPFLTQNLESSSACRGLRGCPGAPQSGPTLSSTSSV